MSKESYEERQQKKEERKAEQREQVKKEKRKKILTWTGVIGGSVILLAVLLFFVLRSSSPEELAGERHQAQGRTHIGPDAEPQDWTTNPPTGGQHAASPLSSGFYDSPQNLRNAVHSLEHGAIVLYYKKDALSEEDIGRVQELTENRYGGEKFLALPYNDMETRYALTAWEYLDKFDEWNESRIERFVDDHMGNGPEPFAPLQ